jgi:hypothetical protein
MPDTNGNLDGKVAFVTGAASGIGRATALAFAREGAHVVVADIDQQGSQDTVRMIEVLGGQALAVSCDVTSGADVQAALTKTVERFGRLDYAFNNAGAEQQPKPTAEIAEEEWDRIITINLKGVFLCLKYQIPLLLQHGGRRDRQHLLRRGNQGLWTRRRLCRRETRRGRPDQRRRTRLRRVEHPDQRHLPRHHRHRDDGPLHRRHPRRTGQGHRPRTDRPHGQTRGDRRDRRLAVLTRRFVRHRPRLGR